MADYRPEYVHEVFNNAKAMSITLTIEDLRDFAKAVAKETISGMASEREEEPVWLTPDQVAERLNVTRSTLWRWAKDGYLSNFKFGNRTRYKKSDVERVEEAEKGGRP